jgi:hypothetical protein
MNIPSKSDRMMSISLMYASLLGAMGGNPEMVGRHIGASRGQAFLPSRMTKRRRWKRARAAGRNPGGWAL